MSESKPTLKMLAIDAALDALETAILLGKLILLIFVVVVIATLVLGVPLHTVRDISAEAIHLHRDDLLMGLGVIVGLDVLISGLKTIWKRWPIFE